MEKIKNIVSSNFVISAGVVFILLVLINVFQISYPVTITTTSRSTEFSVVGEGKVDATPDTAYVDVGITVSNAKTVEVAQQTINEANNKIVEALKKLGIARGDIKTSNYSINPDYSFQEKGASSISGYGGNASISIKIKKIDLAPMVVEEATKAGANQVIGTRFTIDEPEKYRELAREKAIQNAKQQANDLARKLGIKLGKVTNVIEGSSSDVNPVYGRGGEMMMKADAASAPTFEPGTQTISSVVTLFFEKK